MLNMVKICVVVQWLLNLPRVKKEEVVIEVIEAIEADLPAVGDRERGKGLFAKHCAGCHRSGGLGARVGPDLAAMDSHRPAES